MWARDIRKGYIRIVDLPMLGKMLFEVEND